MPYHPSRNTLVVSKTLRILPTTKQFFDYTQKTFRFNVKQFSIDYKAYLIIHQETPWYQLPSNFLIIRHLV